MTMACGLISCLSANSKKPKYATVVRQLGDWPFPLSQMSFETCLGESTALGDDEVSIDWAWAMAQVRCSVAARTRYTLTALNPFERGEERLGEQREGRSPSPESNTSVYPADVKDAPAISLS